MSSGGNYPFWDTGYQGEIAVGIRGKKKSVGYGIPTNIVGYRVDYVFGIRDTRFGPLGHVNIH